MEFVIKETKWSCWVCALCFRKFAPGYIQTVTDVRPRYDYHRSFCSPKDHQDFIDTMVSLQRLGGDPLAWWHERRRQKRVQKPDASGKPVPSCF